MTDSTSKLPFVEITLPHNKITLVSPEDADLDRYNWSQCANGNKYAGRNVSHKILPLHRVVLERKLGRPLRKGEWCDHINRDPLDNRRENLRVATPSQNSCNHGLQSNNTSGYKGVSWSTERQKWEAYIKLNRKRISLGRHKTLRAAVLAYNEAAARLHGEFAVLNPIPE